MSSTACLKDLEPGEELVNTLVFAMDADIRQNKISVPSPIGTAGLGYIVNETLEWRVPDGGRRLKTNERLYQPEASGHYQ
jgi:regulator of nucleoside diphosphate kinase